jgi:ParB family transcriptional regulator, chromosome partitioning protein
VRRGGLGKGLGALIPSEVREDRNSIFREIPLANIRPNPNQPRVHFDDEALSSLAASIQAVGVLQPVLVRTLGGEEYELVAGERRWRAARRASLQTIPALVQDVDDVASLERALVENLHRQDLGALEEAAAYQQLLEDFGFTHDELGARLGRSRSAITNSLRLFQLPPSIQQMLAEGAISAGHARALLGTPDRAYQENLARDVVAEGLSVRAVEEAVRARRPPSKTPKASKPIRTPPDRPAGVLELEEILSRRFDTRVHVQLGAGRGRMIIEFATIEDLQRVYGLMVDAPDELGADTLP